MGVEQTFEADRQALIAACRRLSPAALASAYTSSVRFSENMGVVADVLKTGTWKEQATAAASLRGWFHKDGIADWPAPSGAPTWEADLSTLWDLSTIYVESKYRDIAQMRSASDVV